MSLCDIIRVKRSASCGNVKYSSSVHILRSPCLHRAICVILCTAVGRSGNPGLPVVFGGHNLPLLVEIGLTDLLKSGGCHGSTPIVTTGLYYAHTILFFLNHFITSLLGLGSDVVTRFLTQTRTCLNPKNIIFIDFVLILE